MNAPTPAHTSMPNAIGKYRLLAELGAGGMANVFLGVAQGPSGFNKLLVLKTLRPNLAEDPEIVQMFLDEARLAGRLSHPNVVQTYEVGEEAGRFVLVMEYLDGQALSTILHESRKRQIEFPIAMQVRVVIDALQGLNYAHELKDFDGTPFNIVHRDATPQNLFITYDGQIKVLDFGIAKAVTSSAETRAGIFKGKLAYMAPEQFLGDTIDRRVDIYAVGAMIWEICVGKRLWKGTPDVQILHRVLNGDVPKPSSINPDCPPELERICQKAMARNRDERYLEASSLQEDLENFLIDTKSRVNAREVGTKVAELFKDRRTQVQGLIDAQLRKVANEDTSTFQAIRIPTVGGRLLTGSWPRDDSSKHSLEMSGTGRDSVPPMTPSKSGALPLLASDHDGESSWHSSQNALAGSIPNPVRKSAKGLYVGLGVVAAAIVGGAVFFLSRPQGKQPVAAAATNATVATPVADPSQADPKATATAAPTGDVAVEIKASPSYAKLYFDDEVLPTNPYVKRVAKNGPTHKVKIEAAGHLPRVIEISSDKDSTLNISLDPAPGGGRAAGPRPHTPDDPSGGKPATPTTTSTAPAAATGDSTAKKPGRGIDKSNPFE